MEFTLPPLVPGKLPHETTVVVAMSGGVDSSCAAALCHQAGYKTIGMTLQLWDYTPASNGGKTKEFGTCCALDDVYDARRVCQKIGIPHYVLNMESAFKGAVIDDFVETYLAGATPIPCVRCNQRIKFKELLDKAKTLGADVLVTGHYVRKDIVNGHPVLRMADDAKKDQTYYLFTTTPEQLAFLEFPLGRLEKPKVRELAKSLGLHVHQKKDSYDICFVPGGDYAAVVKKFAPQANQPGNIVHLNGQVLGQHQGIVGFTVGQRKGLPGGSAEALYVVSINAATHEVIVGPRSALARQSLTIKELNWTINPALLPSTPLSPGVTPGRDWAEPASLQVRGAQPEPGVTNPSSEPTELPILVKVRAQHTPIPAILHPLPNHRAEIILNQPEDAIAPGQAAVCYTHQGILLGGGWIEPQTHSSIPKPPLRVEISPSYL